MKIFAYDSIHKNWLLFKDPLEIFSTHSSQEVSVLLEKIELQSKEKNYMLLAFCLTKLLLLLTLNLTFKKINTIICL